MSQGNVRISNGLIPPVNLADFTTISANRVIGSVSGGTPIELTPANVATLLNGTNLGTPSALILTNATSMPLSGMASQAEATIVGRVAGAGAGVPGAITAAQARAIASLTRQKVVTIDKTVVSTTNTILADGSIPQVSEGTLYGTYSITPTQSNSRVTIIVTGSGTWGGTLASIIAALFKDGADDAVAATSARAETANGLAAWAMTYTFLPASVAQIDFTVRIGRSAAAGTIYVPSSSTVFGTAGPVVTVTIEETAP